MSVAAEYYLKSKTARRTARRAPRLPWLPIGLWSAGMTALFAWKAANHAEASSMREYLSWPLLSDSPFWWGGAVIFGVLTLVALVQWLLRVTR